MIVIYVCHKGMALYYEPYTNKSFLSFLGKSAMSYPLRSAYIYTDVFLVLSGLLMTYGTLGKLQKGQKISITSELVGRYVRFMPSMATIILLSTYILPEIGSGPQWNLVTEEADLCKSFGWRNFLMIQNWFGINQVCRPQTHHVATDFTLFGFSLFLVVLIHKHMKFGVGLVIFLGLTSMAGIFSVFQHYEMATFFYYGVEWVKTRHQARDKAFANSWKHSANKPVLITKVEFRVTKKNKSFIIS